MKKTVCHLLLFFAISFSVSAQNIQQSYLDYIDAYHKVAISEMKNYGIPASITLAQGLLESGAGKSPLATGANNHFGIKCRSDWKGERVYQDDDAVGECFRKYPSAKESYEDHSLFLTTGKRYAALFQLDKTDYKGWATGLQKAGYATDKSYSDRLIKIIEDYQLYQYDNPKYLGHSKGVTSSTSNGTAKPKRNDKEEEVAIVPYIGVISPYYVHEEKKINGVKYVESAYGDTYGSIAEEFGLHEWEILRFNDLENANKLEPGTRVYIAPKKGKAPKNKVSHTLAEGETMYQVAQLYGIRLNALYKMNDMEKGTAGSVGKKLRLR